MELLVFCWFVRRLWLRVRLDGVRGVEVLKRETLLWLLFLDAVRRETQPLVQEKEWRKRRRRRLQCDWNDERGRVVVILL